MLATAQIAAQVVQLLEEQKKQVGAVKLLSIKVALPDDCDASEVSNYIVEHYPQYKAHPKDGQKSVLAIGFRK